MAAASAHQTTLAQANAASLVGRAGRGASCPHRPTISQAAGLNVLSYGAFTVPLLMASLQHSLPPLPLPYHSADERTAGLRGLARFGQHAVAGVRSRWRLEAAVYPSSSLNTNGDQTISPLSLQQNKQRQTPPISIINITWLQPSLATTGAVKQHNRHFLSPCV